MTGVTIRGTADPVEVAAVLAVLAREPAAATTSRSAYDQWREQRIRARKSRPPRR